MKTIEMKVKYGGQNVDINIFPEEYCAGTLYPVEADGKYIFTFLQDEEGDWSVMKEADARTPFVEEELYDVILKKLHYELLYAA
ncbi:MAG: hypothetical protein LH615_15910 [Ferruginibacter sp.]|nr:hypothetical protein [Ferruginibacter sp.]